MSGWIKCTPDTLPPMGAWVLGWVEDKDGCAIYMVKRLPEETKGFNWIVLGVPGWNIPGWNVDVKHWRPLLEAPEEEA